MRVLLLAEDDDLYSRGAAVLREGGHDVLACHEAGSAANRWPCAGVTSVCPLDNEVDAAVALRRSAASRIEAGIGCAVRGKVPLVLGGAESDHLAHYAGEVVEGIGPDLAKAVDRVATAPIADLSAAAGAGLAGAAGRLGVEGTLTTTVERHGRSLRVTVHGGGTLDSGTRAALAQAAYAPVRAMVPGGAVDTIDVGFVGAPAAQPDESRSS